MMAPALLRRRPIAHAGLNGLLLLLLLTAFALRLYRLDAQDIWWDEARNIDVASRPLAQIATAGELDIHPPLYFYLLHGWWRLTAHAPTPDGRDAFAVRFLSLWFGVLFVALMYTLGRRIGGFWAGVGAAVGAAFLPFLVGEAQEARMYTVLLVWLAAAGLAVLQGTGGRGQGARDRGQESGIRSQGAEVRGQESRDRDQFASGFVGHPQKNLGNRGFSRSFSSTTQPAKASIPECETASERGRLISWLFFALFSALALLTHYAAAFALVALWAWAGLWAVTGGRRDLWRRVRTVLLAGLVTALLCLPALPVALRQIPSYRNPNLVVPSVATYLGQLAQVYSLGEHLDPVIARPWMWALAALLVGGWVLLGITNQRISNQRISNQRISNQRINESRIRHSLIRSFAVLWSLLPLAVYYLVIMERSTFATRYIAGALPGWLLLTGLAVAGWARLGKPAGTAAALALCLICAPGVIGDLTDPRYLREDTRGLVAWLREETDPAHDIILVDQRYPFGLYWPRWNNSAGGFPPDKPADLAPAQYLFVDINTVAERLSALARGRERVFLVRWFESDTDPRGAATWVLEKFGAKLGERSFRGYTVTWYATAPEAEFELAPTLDSAAVEFGDQVRLEAFALGGRGPGLTSTVEETRSLVAPADQAIWVVARWSRLPGAVEPGKALPRGLKATVVLEDEDGFVVGQDDRPILNDRHLAPLEWSATEQPLGVYLVRAAPATPPGTYTVKLAVYDPVTLAQLPAAGPAARGTFAVLGQVTLTRPTRPAAVEQLPIEMPLSLSWRGLRLLGRGPLRGEVAPGDRLSLDLYWQAEQDSLPELRVRLTLTASAAPGAMEMDAAAWRSPGQAPASALVGSRTLVRDAPASALVGSRTLVRDAPASALAGSRTLVQDAPASALAGSRTLVRDAPASVFSEQEPPVRGYPTPNWRAGDVMRGRQHVRLDPATPPGTYQLMLQLVDAVNEDASPVVLLGQVTVAGRPHVFEAPAQMMQRSGARFGELATLLGYDLVAPVTRGDPVSVTLYWRAEAASTVPYKVSVQLLDQSGILRSQRDQEPGDGGFPTTGWVAGEVLTDKYQIGLPAGGEPATYTVIVKMYDAMTGQTAAVTLADGAPAGDFLRLGEVSAR